ncbi:membrane protein insertase YidC [Clostridium fermenticellae]|uniref:Membrane protein insertase YidC n=1 Tax=Clostridium fermenticellae TaxID=2068654 RepID=A0A386H5I2_9CLOT|nr:YidC/Oxa1 family membrane protein insertase [Clostridium fermenticellae]AYD40916.1 membrane protein insertase YidC [Clostridium fermenticellae]
MFDFIAYPIGRFLRFIYEVLSFKNYGIAIILLTVIIRTLLLPLYIKQYRSTSKMSEIQPKIKKLQEKYKNDNEKLSQHMVELYKENNINPAGGCLPMLLQIPILFSLYYVISQPLKYMFGMNSSIINKLFNTIPHNMVTVKNMHDLSIINYYGNNMNKLPLVDSMLNRNELLNMNFWGINLGYIPTFNFHNINAHSILLMIIPILAVITTYISTKYSSQDMPASENEMQNSIQKNMLLLSPIMTGFISFQVPAGMGLYWIISNIYQIFQQMFMNKFIIKKNQIQQ